MKCKDCKLYCGFAQNNDDYGICEFNVGWESCEADKECRYERTEKELRDEMEKDIKKYMERLKERR